MQPDLDKLRNELPALLEAEGFVVFHGTSRADDEAGAVHWDTAQHPDHAEFLAAARKLESRVIVFHARPFDAASLEDLQAELDAADLVPGERRELERRLKSLRPFTGFTASIELSFDFSGATYIYELRSEFMNEFLSIMEEIDTGYLPPDEFGDDSGEAGSGGYFSRN